MLGIGLSITNNLKINVSSASANISSIDTDGWQATVISVPTEFDPVASPDTFTVTRQGFNAAGAAISVADTITLMKRIRQPYPNQVTLTTDQGSISEFIYANDTITGVTNNSTRAYPRPQALWLNHDLDVATSSTYTVRLAVAHAHARSGRPVAAVKFTATDGTTTVEQTVSSMSTITYTASGKTVPHFSAAMDFSTLTQGAMITIDAIIYPWVGSAFTVSTANTYPSPNLTSFTVLNDRTGGYGTAYAYVDGVGAGTPTVSTNATTAQANPYATITLAIAALQTYNNANFSRNSASGGIVRLEIGTHIWTTNSSTVTDVPVIIEAANAANKATTIIRDNNASTTQPSLVKIKDTVIEITAGDTIAFNSNAGISDNKHMFVTENCDWKQLGTTIWGATVYKVGRFWNINCGGDNIGQCQIFSSARKTSISIGSGNGSMQLGTYHAVGCKDLNGRFTQVVASANRPASSGQFFGWFFLSGLTTDNLLVDFNLINVGAEGAAVVGGIIEVTVGGNPGLGVSADGQLELIQNMNLFGNTVVGARSNTFYNETGTVRLNKTGSQKFNVYQQYNIKTDTHPTASGNRIGNWPMIYQVGNHSLCAITGDASNDTTGIGEWLGEVDVLNPLYGTDASPIVVDWTNDQSADGAAGGNGDYTPGASTALQVIPSGLAPYSHDQNGTAIPDDGTALIGALQ